MTAFSRSAALLLLGSFLLVPGGGAGSDEGTAVVVPDTIGVYPPYLAVTSCHCWLFPGWWRP